MRREGTAAQGWLKPPTPAIRRLRDEARAGFRVHDSNVVRVLDCDVVRGVWYFVMEYVDGVNLAAVLEQKQRFDLGSRRCAWAWMRRKG